MSPRREYYHSPQCVEDGCSERAHYVFSSQREQREEMARLRKRGGWRCVRHTRADEVLSSAAPERATVLVSYETAFGHGGKTHRFWASEEDAARKKGGNGFAYGPGFKAFAADFPVGTRLVVIAHVELPEAPAVARPREVFIRRDAVIPPGTSEQRMAWAQGLRWTVLCEVVEIDAHAVCFRLWDQLNGAWRNVTSQAPEDFHRQWVRP